MKLYLISTRSMASSVSQDPLYELENLIAHACDATILAPQSRKIYKVLESAPGRSARLARSLVRHSIGTWEPQRLPKKTGPEMAFCVAISAWGLSAFEAVPDFRKRFDLVVGYVFDCWGHYPAFLKQMDRVFIPLPEEIEIWHRNLGFRPTLLPLGVDVLEQGGHDDDRPIDLLSYGRVPPKYLAAFMKHFTRRDSRRLFLRTDARCGVEHPAQPYEQRRDHYDHALLFQLLRRSKASLCFDTLYPGMRSFPHSFVTLRWFDAFATGCAAVGKRPTTSEADRLLKWQDAAIDLPESPEDAVAFLHMLFEDRERLKCVRLRNYYHALASHDWRWRLRDMFRSLGLALPPRLREELEQLDELAASAKLRALNAGAIALPSHGYAGSNESAVRR